MLMAAGKMLGFFRSGQSYPEKRSAGERDDDFLEISREFILAKAEEQAARCSQCGVPYCSVHCPLGNHIPDWLKLTARSEEHTSELQSLMRISYAVFCLTKKIKNIDNNINN